MRFRIDALRVASTVIGGITSQSFDDGMESVAPLVDGDISPSFASVIRSAPTIQVGTHDIAAALAATGATNTRGQVDVWALEQADGGGRASGNVHTNYRFSTGCVYPGNLSVSDGEAGAILTLSIAGYANADYPYEVRVNQAAPTPPTLNQVLYSLGPVLVNNVPVVGVTSVNIDFGIAAVPDFGDGRIGAKDVIINARTPTVVISANRPNAAVIRNTVSSVEQGPLCMDTNTVEIFLRRRTCSSYSASSVNVKFTMTAGVLMAQTTDGNPVGVTFMMNPAKTASQATPIAIDTAAALPT
jgi:hypothetical protein